MIILHKNFSPALLNWYWKSNIKFPWRNIVDPYKIWLSEVMLQQTRVSSALPYFNRWIKALPSPAAVVNAEEEVILKLWEGLGYYNRAKNFQRACAIIMNHHGGEIPNNEKQFITLPGVGPYICAAVMSIAFNAPLPAIDGNAVRVISRIHQISSVYPKSKKQITTILKKNIDPNNPGDFNQAIMDLGREICKPLKPNCDQCPIKKYCSSYVNNCVNKYPIRSMKPKKPHYCVATGIVWNNSKVLISKRNGDKLLGGLWEFPGGKIEQGEQSIDCVVREISEELNIQVKPLSLLGKIKHEYSHFAITMDVFNCKYLGGTPRAIGCADWQWISPSEISTLPFPGASHKLFKYIRGT